MKSTYSKITYKRSHLAAQRRNLLCILLDQPGASWPRGGRSSPATLTAAPLCSSNPHLLAFVCDVANAKVSARQQCVYEGHSEEIYGKSTLGTQC